MITFQEEIASEELYEECIELFKEHKEELESNYEPISVDPLSFIRLYRLGKFKFFSAREDNKIIGYLSFFIFPLPHYGTLTAEQDLFFIHKSKRNKLTGVKLLKFAEDSLRLLGIKRILQHSKVEKDIGSIFKRLNYSPIETIYMKEL